MLDPIPSLLFPKQLVHISWHFPVNRLRDVRGLLGKRIYSSSNRVELLKVLLGKGEPQFKLSSDSVISRPGNAMLLRFVVVSKERLESRKNRRRDAQLRFLADRKAQFSVASARQAPYAVAAFGFGPY